MLDLTLRRALVAFFAAQLAGCASLQTQPPRQSDDPNAAITAFAVGTSLLVGAVVVVVIIKTNEGETSPPPPPASSSEGEPHTQFGWGLERRDGRAAWRRCTSRSFCTDERVTIEAADLIEGEKVGRVVPVAMGGHAIGEVDLYVLRVRRPVDTSPR